MYCKAATDAKVPSVVFYDGHGHVCAVGADTEDEETIERFEEEHSHEARWYTFAIGLSVQHSDQHPI
jgi:hypothetical protein